MTKNQYMRVQAVVSIYVHPTCYFMMSYALYYIHIHIFKYFHLHFLYMYMFKGNKLINIIYLLFIYTLVSFLHNHDRAKKTQWEALGFPLNEVRRCFRAHLVVATMFASPNSCWSVPIALDAYSMDVLCSYALATFEYHPSLLIYDYVKSKYIYIYLYVTTIISFLSTLPSILTLGLQGSVLCAAKPEEFESRIDMVECSHFKLLCLEPRWRISHYISRAKEAHDPQNRLGCSVPLSRFAWCFDDSYEQL